MTNEILSNIKDVLVALINASGAVIAVVVAAKLATRNQTTQRLNAKEDRETPTTAPYRKENLDIIPQGRTPAFRFWLRLGLVVAISINIGMLVIYARKTGPVTYAGLIGLLYSMAFAALNLISFGIEVFVSWGEWAERQQKPGANA